MSGVIAIAILAGGALSLAAQVPVAAPSPSGSVAPSPSASPSPAAAPASALEMTETQASFGEVYEGAVVTHRFPFKNRGTTPIRITTLQAVSPRARATAHPEVVPPGGEGYVEVEQPTAGRLGLASFRVGIRTDDGSPERKLGLSGFIQSAYDPDQLSIDLGNAAPGASASLEMSSREVDRLEVREVLDAPAFLAVDTTGRAGPAQEGVVLKVTVRLDAPLGFHSGTLRVRTNVGPQPEASVTWKAGVYEDLIPSESPMDLGLVREGTPFVKVILLGRPSGAPLDVERVDSGHPSVTTELAPCPTPSDSCRALRLSGNGPPAGTALAGTVTVTPKGGRPLFVPYSAILVGAQAKVKDMGMLEPKAEGHKPIEIDFVKGPPPPVPADTPPVVGKAGERRARLTWEAQKEKDTYGYLVYRADRREGPFRRINRDIVRVNPGAEAHTYRYVDEQVEPGRTYYYYLESIDRAGSKLRLSGVMAKVIGPAAP